MTLAIVTPIGRAYEERGRRLLRDFATDYKADFVASPPDKPALLDGFCVRGGVVVAVVEGKMRVGYSLYDVRRMGSSILVSANKLTALAEAAKMFGVPAFVVIETSDGYRWHWNVANADGSAACQWNVRRSVTKSDSVGGPDIERLNGFLQLDEGLCWYAPEEHALGERG